MSEARKMDLEDLMAMVRKFAGERGMNVTALRGTYDGQSISLTAKATAGGADLTKTREGLTFKVMAPLHGLDPDMVGREILNGRLKGMRVTGWNSRAPKSPVTLVRISDGKMFKSSAEMIRTEIVRGLRLAGDARL